MTGSASVSVVITNKRGFIHKARKSDNYTWDEDDKQTVIDILKDNFGIHAVRCEPIDIGGHGRIPDLRTTNYYSTVYFELDGPYHGLDEDITVTEKTKRRNQEYLENKLNLIPIFKEATDGYNPEKVVKHLKAKGLRSLL